MLSGEQIKKDGVRNNLRNHILTVGSWSWIIQWSDVNEDPSPNTHTGGKNPCYAMESQLLRLPPLVN